MGDSRNDPLGVTLAGSLAIAIVAALIAALPDIDKPYEFAVVAVVGFGTLILAGTFLLTRLRRLLRRREREEDLTAYTFDSETGILLKGHIENVALRVSTLHCLVNTLVAEAPPERAKEALRLAGCETGAEWAREFKREVETVGIERDAVLHQFVRWADYDATAGMGRLSIAVAPDLPEGTVTLWNSFLSRDTACVPLNHWFAGYIEGTLQQLLGRECHVELATEDERPAEVVAFRVRLPR